MGALADYISTPNDKFQPMNANYGILPALDEKIKLIHIISKSGDRYGSEFVKLINYAQANGIDAQGTKDIPLYIIQKFLQNSYTKPNAGAEVEPEPVK